MRRQTPFPWRGCGHLVRLQVDDRDLFPVYAMDDQEGICKEITRRARRDADRFSSEVGGL